MSELAQLKSQLRSLVVSSPTAVDARALLRDYRSLMGEPLPAARHGYRDPVQFLRERCADCFVFQGPTNNPVLTLIVPDQLKHIDEFVQRQKMPSTKHFKVKRRSVPETHIHPQKNLIAKTFVPPPKQTIQEDIKSSPRTQPRVTPAREEAAVESVASRNGYKSDTENMATPRDRSKDAADRPDENGHSEQKDGVYSKKQLQRFLQKRIPALQAQQLERAPSADSLRDEGRRAASSGSGSSKQAALERLKDEIYELVAERPEGLWVTQLMRLYEERFGRELNYARLGFASIAACACACAAGRLAATRAAGGDWQLRPAHAPPAPPPRRAPAPRAPRPSAAACDPDDALPGIQYDADVFPADCLSFVESIPAASVDDIAPGDMIDLVVGEVYSPSHLWVLRLGPDYDKMEDIMDEMTHYYTRGAGAGRALAAGARRAGQYCASAYEGDWHRALVVQAGQAGDTVKVRHVDYGTVDAVAAAALRPLRREWAALPAQALRARLAGLRPPAAGRRWPRAAAAHCLRLVRDRRLVGNVVAVDREERIVELLLIDTSTAEDVSVTDEMVRAGHADARASPALRAPEAYLLPPFAALETGATPNYAEIHALLRDGISLDYVEAYRRHVSPERAPEPPPALPAGLAARTLAPSTGAAHASAPTVIAGQTSAPSAGAQTCTANTVPARTFTLNTTAGQIFTPNTMAGQIFTSNTVAQTFTPNTALGQTFAPNTTVGQIFTPYTTASQIFTSITVPQSFTPNTALGQTFTPNTTVGQIFTPNTTASQIFTLGTVAQTFTPNTVPGQTFTPNTTAGQIFTPNTTAGQIFTLNAVAQPFTPNTVPGQTITLNTTAGQTFTPNTTVGQIFTPNIVAQTFTPNIVPGQTFTPNTTAGQIFTFNAVTRTFTPNTVPVQTFTSGQTYTLNAVAQPFTPNIVPGQTFTPNTTAGRIFASNMTAAQIFAPNSTSSEIFTPNAGGPTFPPNTGTYQAYTQNMATAHTFTTNAVTGPIFTPGTGAAQTFTPQTASTTTFTPGAPASCTVGVQASPWAAPRHPAAFYAAPPGFAPWPCAAPAPGARLSADDCEVFELLSLVDARAAHRYVARALRHSRALGPPPGFGHPAPLYYTPQPPPPRR